MAAYQAALGAAMLPIGTNRSKPGTVAAAVAAFLQSPDFTRRATGTRDQRRPILQRFRDQYGRMPMGLLPPKFIHAKLGEMKPHAARNWFKTIRALCQFCVLEELIQIDPTASLKTPKVPKSNGHHTWTEDEIAQFQQFHRVGSKAHLALALGTYTLQRRSDVIEMGRQHIGRGEVIKVGSLVIDRWLRAMQQKKTGTGYHIPIFPQLQAILAATPSTHLTFLTSKSGQPYKPNDFSEQFRAWCDEAGWPKRCTFHGLRKYGCVYFAERGCSAPEIASWSGHMSFREVERYIRDANQKRLARNALVRVLTAEAEEQTGSETVKVRDV